MTQSQLTVGDLTLHPPKDWPLGSMILFGQPEMMAGGDNPQSSAFQQNIVVMTQDFAEEKTVEDFAKEQQENLQQAGVLHRPPRGHEPIALAGAEQAVLIEHVLRGEQGEKVRQLQLVAKRGKTLLVATASHLDGVGFEANREAFRHMLTTLRWGA